MKFAVAAAAALVVAGTQAAECATATFADLQGGDAQGGQFLWIEEGMTIAGTGGGGDPYENIGIEGYLGPNLVASEPPFKATAASKYLFGLEFSAIDRLIISAVGPETIGLGGTCGDAPCAHFSNDNVTFARVPLSDSAWFLITGLAGIFILGRRRTSGRSRLADN
jgi:hypothetical protein